MLLECFSTTATHKAIDAGRLKKINMGLYTIGKCSTDAGRLIHSLAGSQQARGEEQESNFGNQLDPTPPQPLD